MKQKKTKRLMNNLIKNEEWIVYVHIVPKIISDHNHDKYYVGITKRNPNVRWGLNGCGYKNIYFYNAIKKYGWDNIEHHIIASNLTHDEANTFEKILIQKLKSNNKEYGYNISDGGDGGNRKELKPVKQYDLSGNFIKRYPSAASAANVLGIDRTHITRVCKHGGTTHGFMFCYESDDITKPFTTKKQRVVVQTSLDGVFIAKYYSIHDASVKTEISSDCICKCVTKKNSRAGNFLWYYEDDYNERSRYYDGCN